MTPSFISSSDMAPTAPRPSVPAARSRMMMTVLGVVLVLGALEAALRSSTVMAALPVRTHFHEPGVVTRMDALDQTIRQYGRVDVLFVGSSIVRCNIRPDQFDALIMAERGERFVSFNAGLSGLWPDAVRLYLEDLWLPVAHPRVVVQGIRLGELLPSTHARKYADIVNGAIESSWTEAGSIGRLRAMAFEDVHLLQYRGTWPAWLLAYRNGRPGAEQEDERRVFTDSRGWTPRTPTLDVVLARHLLDKERPNPAIADSRTIAGAVDAIRASFRATTRSGAEYVLLNVPEHAFRWSGADGRARYASYLNVLQQLADAEGFRFIDVTGGDPGQFAAPADYSDYHHMSPEGAQRFTRLVAGAFSGGPGVALPPLSPPRPSQLPGPFARKTASYPSLLRTTSSSKND